MFVRLGEVFMINLMPWRERHFFIDCITAASIITFFAVGLMIVAIVLSRGQAIEKKSLYLKIQGLSHSLASLKNGSKKSEQIKQINQIIWRRHRYIAHVVKTLASLPKSVTLLKAQCTPEQCVMDVTARDPNTLASLKNFQVNDIKQGGCPKCYQANIAVNF